MPSYRGDSQARKDKFEGSRLCSSPLSLEAAHPLRVANDVGARNIVIRAGAMGLFSVLQPAVYYRTIRAVQVKFTGSDLDDTKPHRYTDGVRVHCNAVLRGRLVA